MAEETEQAGSIFVDGRPSGASIKLHCADGTEKVFTETTPHTIKNVPPGTHVVTITYEGISKSTEAKVEAGKSTTVSPSIMTKEMKATSRLVCVYSVIFMLALIAVSVATRLTVGGIVPPSEEFTRLLIYITSAGGLGALAFNIYVYVFHVGRADDFRPEYLPSYLLRPFLGFVYGIFAFTLVAGGLMMLEGTATPGDLLQLKAKLFYIALAFLAGYAGEPFSLQLKSLAESIFKSPSKGEGK